MGTEMKSIALALVASLAGCATKLPPLGNVTISDVSAYLVQSRCQDGSLEIVNSDCVGARSQTSVDTMVMRRADWPPPTGYMDQDAYLGPSGPQTIWSYAPHGPFIATNGDGGEVYAIEADGTVRISATQDGGTPYLQGFYGANCGATGWMAFRPDAPTGSWATLIATLKDQEVPSGCPILGYFGLGWSKSFTRYRLENVTLPFVVAGAEQAITLPTIISEHYNRSALAASTALERSMWSKGVGRVVWEAWTTTNPLPVQANRCPGTVWSVAPGPGWTLNDCRYGTNVVIDNDPITGQDYGWPPAIADLP